MIEVALGAVAVAVAWAWRMSFDAGRAHQRRRSVLNPGEAFLFDHSAMRRSLMLTPEDGRRLIAISNPNNHTDDWFYRCSAAMAVDNPYAVFRMTGVSA